MSWARQTPEAPDAPTVVIGVGAGIAAYKVPYVVRGLRRLGCQVFVIPTESSLQFVGIPTWQELSENPVGTGVFHGPQRPGHIDLARSADLFVVAPCTADLGAKLRAGLADDLLTATFLASTAPKLLVPAMHTGMWLNAATVENFSVLAERGIHVLAPVSGALSSGDTGQGRMPEPEEILQAAKELLFPSKSNDLGKLAEKNVVISAGGTIEPIDPVRYLGNRSSGRQGVELAKAAANAGAQVTLLAARCSVPLPQHPRITVVPTLTAAEMEAAVMARLKQTDLLVMAAAVADYRPAQVADQKLKKEGWGEAPTLLLEANPDILARAAASSSRPPVVVGFAAETGDEETVRRLGCEKARRKGADLIAINRVGEGRGFGDVENQLWVVDGHGEMVSRLEGTKADLAQGLLAVALDLLCDDS